MKQLLLLILLLPTISDGQTKLSQLSTAAPDANTSLIGLENISGAYTDYFFGIGDLATYINSSSSSVTSVGLSMPGVFSVTPAILLFGGTFSVVATGGQPANAFYATPNGSSGALGLRTITSTDLPAAGTPGTYGDATHIPGITIDAFGRVTAATSYLVTASEVLGTQSGLTAPTGPGMYSSSTTSTVIVYMFLNITSIASDILNCDIEWTDENGIMRTYGFGSFSSIGYHSLPPITVRVKSGAIVAFLSGLSGGGSINYDIGWQILY